VLVGVLLYSYEENPMAEINGKLMADLLPNGTVRVVFVPRLGSGNEAPLTVKNLPTAEREFVSTFGITPFGAAWIRGEVERNKVFCILVDIDDKVAAMFRRAQP
jgi:hypothetical protein